MKENQEYLSVGIGQWSHFYTLRINVYEKKYVRGHGPNGNCYINGVWQGTIEFQWKQYHIKNLSQDYNEAIIKAREYADKHNQELRVNVEEWDLNEIRRRKSEEIAEEERRERIRRDEQRETYLFKYQDPRGLIFYFGQYKGQNVYDVAKKDREYLEFIAEKSTNESTLVDRIKVIVEHLPPVEKQISSHVGSLKERLTIKCKLVFAKHIERDFMPSFELLKFRDADGNLFVSFFHGVVFCQDIDIGDEVTIKGTVKKHDEYQGVKQTIINRIKLIS